MSHTPGPWRVGTPGPNGCYTIGTTRGLMTAMIAHSINHPDQADQARGDANLIAAAPELLEALEACANELAAWLYSERSVDEKDIPEVVVARAIIARVRGNS